MTIQKYSKKESLNRIYRVLGGSTPTDETAETLQGDVYSEDDALSRLAELLSGGLDNEYFDYKSAYGEIYTHTGTMTIQPATGAWRKITGSFQNNYGYYSNVVPDANDDRILISDIGIYWATYNLSFVGSSDVTYGFSLHVDNAWHIQLDSAVRPAASGSAVMAMGSGLVYISGSSVPVDVRVWPGQNAFFRMVAGQLVLQRIGNA